MNESIRSKKKSEETEESNPFNVSLLGPSDCSLFQSWYEG